MGTLIANSTNRVSFTPDTDVDTVTLAVTDIAGQTVTVDAPTETDNVWSLTIQSAALPDNLVGKTWRFDWTLTTGSRVREVIELYTIQRGRLCSIAEVRAADRALTDTVKYPDLTIELAIAAAEQTIEKAACLAFLPRTRTYSALGDGTLRFTLPDNAIRSVAAVSVDGTALTPTEIAALTIREWGALDAPTAWRLDKVVSVTYDHGLDEPPAPITRAAVILAVDELVPSGIPSRATAATVGDQMFRITVAGRDGETGIPYVDAAITRFGRRRPVIA